MSLIGTWFFNNVTPFFTTLISYNYCEKNNEIIFCIKRCINVNAHTKIKNVIRIFELDYIILLFIYTS